MHNPESVRENETHKFLLDIVIRMTWPRDSQQQKKKENDQQQKKTCRIVNFDVPADHRVKLKESEKRNNYLDLSRELKNYETGKWGDTNCNWFDRNNHQGIISTRTGGFENKRTSGDHLNYSIIKIGQNTEKNHGDLRGLTITQTPTRNHQLVWKLSKK